MQSVQPKPLRALTRLQPGHIIMLFGRPYRVDMVNDSRARCYPVLKTTRTFTPKTGVNADKTLTITETGEPQSISPNAECDIIGHWDGQAAHYFTERTERERSPVRSAPESTVSPELVQSDLL